MRLTDGTMNQGRWQAWFRDQYKHPHESRHSIDEVLGWFDASGVEFLCSLPPADGGSFGPGTRLFKPQRRGRRLEHLATELRLLLEGGRDGGLFIMIGRKRP